VPLSGQLTRQAPGRLRRPPQRRHRITAFIRLDQGQQRRQQPGIQLRRPLTPSAGPAGPAQRLRACVQIGHTPRHGALRNADRPGHQPDPAMPENPGLGHHQQTTLRSSRCGKIASNLAASNPSVSATAHTTLDRPHTENGYLFLCGPLAADCWRCSTCDTCAVEPVRHEPAAPESSDKTRRPGRPDMDWAERLSPDQVALLERLADGQTIAAAAAAEWMSLRTANRRLAELRTLLGLRSNRELVAAYARAKTPKQ